MLFWFYAAAIICLVLAQTVIMPFIPCLHSFYDVLIPFIICLGLFRSLRESLPVVLLCGFLIDGLSGGSFGLYSTTYIWLYICCRCVIRFFHAENRFILFFSVVLGVILQNIIFFMLEPGDQDRYIMNFFQIQVICAFITGPFLLAGFKQVFIIFDKRLYSERS